MKFGFDFKHFKGDLFGGLTSGIVALPLALAFGVQSGMGATAGLYGAIFISFFAALFGGTNTQISGPTAPMTAVSMVIIAGITAANDGDLGKALPYILMVFLLSGLIQVLLGLLKVGQYIRYIPYPVISGFMTGIGVIILITQILPTLGYYPKEDISFLNEFKPQAQEIILEKILREKAADDVLVLEDFKETINRAAEITDTQIMKEAAVLAAADASGVLGALKLLPRAAQNINYINLFLALLTILIIYGFKTITTAVPSSLVALLGVSLGAYFGLGEDNYRAIGTIPSGFPIFYSNVFSEFSWSQISPYIFTAISLAALGAIDSLLTSIVADNMTKTKHNPNQELVGQGIGNSIAALFGGIPGAGATIRTVVNINSGGKTKLSGMIAGLLLLVVLLALGQLASKIPAAVLAGILITVGIGVMDYKGLRHIFQLPVAEVIVMFTVLGLTIFVGLIQAVLVGLILSSILFMKKISDVVDHRTNTAPLKEFSREIMWQDEADLIHQIGDKIYIKHLDGPLFFGFASRFQDMINALPDVQIVIIRMDRVPYVDQSGLYAMEDALITLQDQDIKVCFTGLSGQPLDIFERFNLIPSLVEQQYSFKNFEECAQWIKESIPFEHQNISNPIANNHTTKE
ncbi:SulP family inorganic anion transporter [Aureispira anguillae]|uniref:SulP family inorganic anion transporter n=1 Tax=Aureispira anguillae TaxID=2864201 RepID=A0A916DNS9_9BACT|nr:SulP family inorganic anion transporter [Aureispira anguillae]BDS09756.1 SulP family inorganic anion transporter [Aureispira anguillae]